MKKQFLVFLTVCLATMLQAAVSKTVNLTTAGTLSTVLTAAELTTVTDLTLTGNVDARDFTTMGSSMSMLTNVDMRGASIVPYTGSGGPYNAETAYPANKVPNYSFAKCTKLISVILPSSVTLIGNVAFNNCTALTSVTIPSSVTAIGSDAFNNCSSLTSISIPSSITSIGNYAFWGCSSLSSITVCGNTPVNLSAATTAFSGISKTVSFYVPTGSKAAYTAAAVWKTFTNVIEFNPTVGTINTTAGGLEVALSAQLNLIKTLTITGTIDARDFKTMRDLMPLLEDIDLSGATIVAYTGTAGTNGTTSMVYDANVLPVYSFCNHSIYDTYEGKTSLKSIKLPNSVTSIGDDAFKACNGLTTIGLSNSLTSIGDEAFSVCSGLTTISIPNSVTSIGRSAFSLCDGLTTISIPNSVTSIGIGAFSSCSGLTTISIPSSITSIEDGVFWSCGGLTSISIPNSVTSIGSEAFWNCHGLTTISIPNSVTSIGSEAFNQCSGLTTISIPNSVTSIGRSAFYSCSSLKSIKVFNPTPIVLSGNLFEVPSVIPLYVPVGSKAAYAAADYWKDFTNIIEFDPSVATIANTAGGLATALSEQLPFIKKLTITGTIDARDFKTMRDLMPLLEDVDLSGATVVAYAGSPANEIPSYAFYRGVAYPVLKSIKLPNTVTTIGSQAFSFCSGLTNLSIPNSVTTIKSMAFELSGLTSISIPNSVTSIGDRLFNGCTGLNSIKVFNSTPVALPSNYVFNNVSKTISLYVPVGSKAAYAAADYWKEFTNIVEFDPSVATIANAAGGLATALSAQLNLVKTLTITGNIDKRDFETMRYKMPLLEDIDLSGATIVEYTRIGIEPCLANVVPVNAFDYGATNCRTFIKQVKLPNSATSIGIFAFRSCCRLTSISIPSSLTSIGNAAFNGCSGLKSISIPSSLTSIGDLAFGGCSSLTSIRVFNPIPVTLPSSYVFGSTSKTIPLYVPVGSKALYAAADYWKEFTNIIELSVVVATPLNLAKEINSTTTAVVTATTNWTASTTDSWLDVSPKTATDGNGAITFKSITANTSVDKRTATVTIKADGVPTQTITVTQDAGDATLSITPTTLSIAKDANSSNTVAVSSNTAWTPATTDTWLKVSAGKVGAGTLTITANTANPNDAPRTGSVTVTVAGLPVQTIAVTQAANPTLTLSGTTVSVGKAATSEMKVAVTSNTTWTATTTATWLTVSPNVATKGSASLYFIAATANPLVTPRTATVTVSAAGVAPQTVTVTQVAGDPTLLVNASTIKVTKTAGYSTSVAVTANTAWTASSSESWLTVSNSTANPSLITLTVAATNPSIATRVSTVTLSATANGITVTKTIKVTQDAGDPTLSVDANAVTVGKASGSAATIMLSSNSSWTIGKPSETWLTVSALSNTSLLIAANSANPLLTERTATFTINEISGLIQTITVTQAAGDATLSVPSTLELGAVADNSKVVDVVSNTTWKATSSAAWLLISPSTATGSASFQAFAKENKTIQSRTATITLTASGVANQKIAVTQAAGAARVELGQTELFIDAIQKVDLAIPVQSNTAWTSKSSADWLTVSPASSKDTAPLSFVAAENKTIKIRTATVTVSAANVADKTISVTQSPGQPTVAASSEYTKFRSAQDTLKVDVLSNAAWKISTDAAWLHLSVAGDTANASFLVVADTNKVIEPRTATVVITAKDANPAYVSFTQDAAAPVVVITPKVELSASAVSVDANGTPTSITVTSNTTTTATSYADWLQVSLSGTDFASASSTLSFGSATETTTALWFVAASNTTAVERTSTITIVAGDVTKQITITQPAAPVVVVTPKVELSASAVSVDANGTPTSITVTSNTTATATSDADWLQVSLSGTDFASASSTLSFGSATETTTALWFVAASNSTSVERTSTITIVAGDVTKQITITQPAAPAVVVTPKVELSASAVSVDANGTPTSITVTSNVIATATSDADWLQVSLSGTDIASASSSLSFGSATETTTALWFVAASNTTSVERTSTITIVAGDVTKQITITQPAAPVVVVTPKVELSTSAVSVDANGTPTSITVTSNTTATATSDADWLQVSLSGTDIASASSSLSFGSATETTTALWFVAASNTTSVERTSTITIVAGDVTKVITITQPAALVVTPYLTASKKEHTMTSVKQEFWFIVNSNVAWEKSCSATWITTRMNADTCFVNIAANVLVFDRMEYIYFTAKDVDSLKISVVQAGEAAHLTLSENITTVSAEGASAFVVVKSNANWQTKVSESWITTRSSNDTIYYTVLANPSTSSRSAQIEVSYPGVTTQKLSIQQNAKSGQAFVTAATTATAEATANTIRIAVSANTTWSALCISEWLDITQSVQTGNGEIIIAVQANPTAQARNAKIMLTGTGAAGQMITLTQAAGTGVDATEANAESITIYPNPTTAYFTVNTSSTATVAVYTQAGALLVSTTATSTDQIMLDAFAAGTYIVKVTTPTGVTEHTLIKQ